MQHQTEKEKVVSKEELEEELEEEEEEIELVGIDLSQDDLCCEVSASTGVELSDVKKVLDAFIQTKLVDMKLK